ncbi:hypothetical protein [Mastigocoleus testarum]|uniref:Low temperature-induced protein n=1 Tax=Mastigocoleus testarum BC008 TaxID=371196 RepID=A0A0V8A037_9CYAN|nr:hypothetical protein [Mastigocoleus testarum]KST69983.1 hypothetical protein BC008_05970 [Mastigocoleus testarum BC008]
MENTRKFFANIRPLQFLVAVFTCLTLLFSSAYPAFAIGSYKSTPSEGETSLNQIQKETDKVASSKAGNPDLEESQAKTRKGLNSVQGSADKNKMKRPSNSQSATTVQDKVEGFLENVTGN